MQGGDCAFTYLLLTTTLLPPSVLARLAFWFAISLLRANFNTSCQHLLKLSLIAGLLLLLGLGHELALLLQLLNPVLLLLLFDGFCLLTTLLLLGGQAVLLLSAGLELGLAAFLLFLSALELSLLLLDQSQVGRELLLLASCLGGGGFGGFSGRDLLLLGNLCRLGGGLCGSTTLLLGSLA
jgi:hypothetical protein